MGSCPLPRKRSAQRNRIRQIAVDFCASLIVFLIVFGIAVVDSDAAFPAEIAGAGNTASSALLLQTKRGNAIASPAYESASEAGADIKIRISGGLAEAVVTQRFFNPNSEPAAGAFTYALPENAILHGIKIRNGAQMIETRLDTRDNASELRQASQRLAGPAMAPEAERAPGLWLPIASVAPNSFVTVELSYSWLILADSGRFELAIPMPHGQGNDHAATNRQYSPAPHAARLNSTKLAIELDAGFPIARIESPTHQINVERRTDGTARINLLDPGAATQKRLVLGWTLQAGMLPSTAIYRQTFAGEDYVLALITPPSPEARISIRSREIVYLIDNSGAMAGRRLERIKAGLLSSLAGLEPGDRLNIIAYGNGVRALFSKPVELNRDTRIAVEDFINSMRGEGAAAMVPALKAALAEAQLESSGLVRQVVVVTAGLSLDEPELIATIANGRGRSRLLLIGFEETADAEFMRRAAEIGRGSYTALRPDESISQRISQLLNKLSRPVVSDLKAEWAGGLRVESFPAPLPDLNAGEPVALIAKASALKGKLIISGDLGGSSWTSELSLARAKPATGIAALWTQRKIATLEARRFGGQDASDIDAAIAEVAIAAGIASRSTNWVAVNLGPIQRDDRSNAYPGERSAIAHGWDFDHALPPLAADNRWATAETKPKPKPVPAGLNLPITVVSLPGTAQPDASVRAMSLDKAATTLAQGYRRLAPNHASFTAFSSPEGALQRGHDAELTNTGDRQFERFFNILVLALVFAGMCTLVIGLWRQLKSHYIEDNSSSRFRS